MAAQNALAVRKSVVVDAPPEVAFDVFTRGIGSWWPYKTHSVSGQRTAGVTLEPREGGRVYETDDAGVVNDWGVITAWEPPVRVAFTWHPGYDDPAQHTDVDVTFAAEGAGTRVELVHTGWERLGERAAESVKGYTSGWDTVLGRYADGVKARAA